MPSLMKFVKSSQPVMLVAIMLHDSIGGTGGHEKRSNRRTAASGQTGYVSKNCQYPGMTSPKSAPVVDCASLASPVDYQDLVQFAMSRKNRFPAGREMVMLLFVPLSLML